MTFLVGSNPTPSADQQEHTRPLRLAQREPFARSAAQLCRLAGADQTLISKWAEEGKRRAAAARMRPHRDAIAEAPSVTAYTLNLRHVMSGACDL